MPMPARLQEAVNAILFHFRCKPLYINTDEAGYWEYNPYRRHLLCSTDSADIAEGLTAHILSKSAYLGRGYIRRIPEHLEERAKNIRATLLAYLRDWKEMDIVEPT